VRARRDTQQAKRRPPCRKGSSVLFMYRHARRGREKVVEGEAQRSERRQPPPVHALKQTPSRRYGIETTTTHRAIEEGEWRSKPHAMATANARHPAGDENQSVARRPGRRSVCPCPPTP